MKKLIIFITFLSIASVLFGQERITLTTTKAVGTSITLYHTAGAADRSEAWIDLNNNGVRDNGEDITQWNSGTAVNYTLQSQTITIYGKLTYFRAGGQGLTALDLSNARYLEFLRVDDNQIQELDMSALPPTFYNLHISKNRITGVLDLSHLNDLTVMNIDRNYFTSVILGNHPKLNGNINISRNPLSEAAIDAILEKVPVKAGAKGSFYLIDTRTTDTNLFPDDIELKQHHLTHRVFTQYNWGSLDVNNIPYAFSDIGRLTNKFTTSFTTAKPAGERITLNIDAETSDHPSVWIDLNGNGTKDGNEAVTVFGSNASYTISSPNITVYGLASKISAVDNQLTKFNASKNKYLTELNLALNNLTVAELTTAITNLTDRSSLTAGSLTLIDFEGDANQINGTHINQANAKNWTVKDNTGRTLSPADVLVLNQTIRSLSDISTYPSQVFTLPTLTDQGLAVTYSIEAGKEAIATLVGNTLTSRGLGTVTLTATQAGSEVYQPFSKTITVNVMTIGETFSWLELPTIGIVEDNAFIAGPGEAAAHFTRFYINDVPVDMADGNVDLTNHSGSLKLKATNADGSQIIRLNIER